MPIYTKTGDSGETSLFGGKRVKKYDKQIEAYGSVDELSSHIGLVISRLKDKRHIELLTLIQKDLYIMMATLSGAKTELKDLKKHITIFEKDIDLIDKKLGKLTRFILPQGGEVASLFHIARTVCRRAERDVVRFSNNGIIVKYFNRLSDLLFMMARWYGREKEVVV